MKPKIYASKNIARYIARLTNEKQAVLKSGLKVECVPNGQIVIDGKITFGVFDQNGSFVKTSMQSRGRGQLIPPESALGNLPYFDYDAVYIGNLCGAFGHYLLEGWPRVYAFLDEKYRNMKFVIVNDEQFDPIPNFVLELARLLRIPAENFVILDTKAQFKNVYVPENSFRLETIHLKIKFSSIEFGKIYAKIADNVKEKYAFEKIYVSRAALNHRKTYGEGKVQEIFEKNGYHIIYPEQLPLEEQIAFMKNCKYLAGCAGTALHLALFMPEGGNVVQMKRNKLKDGNDSTQFLITQAKNLNLTYIDGSIEKYKTNHYDSKPQIIGVNGNMKRFFDENKFNYSPNDMQFDKESWDEYICAVEKYQAQRRKRYGGKSDIEVYLRERIAKFLACFIFDRNRRVALKPKIRKALGV